MIPAIPTANIVHPIFTRYASKNIRGAWSLELRAMQDHAK